MTWDFDVSTMIRPSKSSEASSGASPTAAGTAAVSNQWPNDQDTPTPTESNHVPFTEEEAEHPVSPQLGIDETAMALESGSRKSFVEGDGKRDSVVLIGEETDSPGATRTTADNKKVT